MFNPTDARVFTLLADTHAWTARQVARAIDRSPVVALRSLRRLTDAGLVIERADPPAGFGTGSEPSRYTAVPGVKFPGVTPWGQRKTRKAAPRRVTVAPPAIIAPPQPVTAAPTLAGPVRARSRCAARLTNPARPASCHVSRRPGRVSGATQPAGRPAFQEYAP